MSTDARRAVVAFTRFGYGPRPGDLAVLADLAFPETAAVAPMGGLIAA